MHGNDNGNRNVTAKMHFSSDLKLNSNKTLHKFQNSSDKYKAKVKLKYDLLIYKHLITNFKLLIN